MHKETKAQRHRSELIQSRKGEDRLVPAVNSTGGKVDRARVLLADATPMGAQLLGDMLRRSGRFAQVVVAGGFTEVMSLIADQPIDVLLISSHFEGDAARGLTLAREVCTLHSRIKVVMLLEAPEPERVVEAFRAGCKGVFYRAHSVKDLAKCLACVHRDQIWASSQEVRYLLKALRESLPFRTIRTNSSEPLTERETAVVRYVADGLTNREVAAELGVSPHTVKNYLFRIFNKLGVSSRVELIYYVMGRTPVAARVA